MSRILKTTIRSLGQRFYYENAGLFVISFFVFFGFLRAEEHLAIAQSIAHNSYLLAGTILIYTLYTIGTFIYIRNSLQRNENRFLWSIRELPILKSTLTLIYNQSFMNLPATIHGLLVLYFSIIDQNLSYWLLLFYLLLSHIIPVWLIQNLLTRSYQVRHKISLLSSLNLTLPRPPWSWNLIYSVEKTPAFWLLGKPIAFLILNSFIWINQVEKYPLIWMNLGVLICTFVNIPLTFQFYQFEAEKLSFNKNMPWNTWAHLARISICITVSLAAEILFLVYNYPKAYDFMDLLSLVSLMLSSSITIYTLLARFNLNQEQFYKRCFWSFLILFTIILAGVPGSLLSLVGLCITLLFYTSYYRLFIH